MMNMTFTDLGLEPDTPGTMRNLKAKRRELTKNGKDDVRSDCGNWAVKRKFKLH